MPDVCPCGSGKTFPACCAMHHNGTVATTAEALMRARYSAFASGNAGYLLESWHSSTRPADIDLSGDEKWLGLRIIHTTLGGPADTTGTVEFVARYKINGKAYRLHEVSRFERQDGCWVYLDGDVITK